LLLLKIPNSDIGFSTVKPLNFSTSFKLRNKQRLRIDKFRHRVDLVFLFNCSTIQRFLSWSDFMNILITGGAGFIGANSAAHLPHRAIASLFLTISPAKDRP